MLRLPLSLLTLLTTALAATACGADPVASDPTSDAGSRQSTVPPHATSTQGASNDQAKSVATRERGVPIPSEFMTPAYLPEGFVAQPATIAAVNGSDVFQIDTLYRWTSDAGAEERHIRIVQNLYVDGLLETLRQGDPIDLGGKEAYHALVDDITHRLVWSEGEVIVTLTGNGVPLDELLRVAEGMEVSDGSTAGSLPTPAPTVNPTMPTGVHTPDDMRAQFEAWPDDYKIAVTEDVVVMFTYPAPAIDWVGPLFIRHIPSFSSVVMDFDGRIMSQNYGGPEGKAAIQEVLGNQALMARIAARDPESRPAIERPPMGADTEIEVRAMVERWPAEYRIWIDQDVAVLLAYPGPLLDWAAPVMIHHIPSASQANVDLEGCVLYTDYRSPEAQARIETVIADEALMAAVKLREDSLGYLGMAMRCKEPTPTP